MLYATTRSKVETFTAQRVLRDDRAPDGGCYIPVQMPVFSRKEILELKNQTPGECIARVMNLFFSTELSGLDVEFVLGRGFFGLKDMSHRIVVAELWRNGEGKFDRLVRILYQQVCVEPVARKPGEWMVIAAKICCLFAMYGELQRREITDPRYTLDIAVESGDFTSPMAAWYARKMGLPIGDIVICCGDDSGIWDLVSKGQMKVNPAAAKTSLERLIYGALNWSDAELFVEKCGKKGVFTLNSEKHRLLRTGLSAAVVSTRRRNQTIPNVYRTNGYVLHPDTALIYAGLQDHRAVAHTGSHALILSLDSPMTCADQMIAALGIDERTLRKSLNIL